jgi:hypothetical protein
MSPSCSHLYHNERGMTLILVLALLAVLTVVGTTAVTLTSTDLLVGGNYKSSQLAFYNAEAGVQYTLGRIPAALSTNALHLDGTTTSEDFAITAPSGFAFALAPTATFKRVANTRNYYFQVTGRPAPNSSISSTIEMVIRRATFLPYGLFGDELVSLNKTHPSFPFGYYSYDSRTTPIPNLANYPANSTGEADVGSNGEVSAYPNTYIDGDVALGDDGGSPPVKARFTNPTPALGTPTVTGQADLDVERVNPDPLGASGGNLAAAFTAVSQNNNNVFAGITGNVINLSAGQSVTLTAGPPGSKSNYYLQSITLNPDATLNIDTSGGGEVNIYLTGGLVAQPGSQFTFTGPPPDFTIYSDSTDPIIFRNFSVFKGTVYAPFARVEMKNRAVPIAPNSVAYGLIWADVIDMAVDTAAGGTFFFDTALKDKFVSNNVSAVSWKEFQN